MTALSVIRYTEDDGEGVVMAADRQETHAVTGEVLATGEEKICRTDAFSYILNAGRPLFGAAVKNWLDSKIPGGSFDDLEARFSEACLDVYAALPPDDGTPQVRDVLLVHVGHSQRLGRLVITVYSSQTPTPFEPTPPPVQGDRFAHPPEVPVVLLPPQGERYDSQTNVINAMINLCVRQEQIVREVGRTFTVIIASPAHRKYVRHGLDVGNLQAGLTAPTT